MLKIAASSSFVEFICGSLSLLLDFEIARFCSLVFIDLLRLNKFKN